ncbi:NAD(P)/FAD-dependent oxidoreductase [Flavobacterium sp. ANB]|uniref:NAD(P)/FAD-dependent oxidoreductase n=1 Tax=unclassified Flavobacterium TaxID=196869 RepID=UPI0012B9DF7B|nr:MULTISPECIES: NAD(P)/FAD-dependent oxidoreductase [unclassified Flavobacterium]MBF4519036.1 NAD(P)/FAD-dependent oxidoreductase [Flavobacterium sp. ANB]MTD71764.1 NAD(P)/FAD-dependent oxidoreductase [Flavobacterium sp. LC2016-13]
MTNKKNLDAIIIGGSYAGLSAGMALGRALRNVLIIDSGKPCNSQTPHSHNFLTQDGKTPKEILSVAKEQVLKYKTIHFYGGLVVSGSKTETGFEIETQSGEKFRAKKLIFATGIKDIIPPIKGFSDCWGISIIHCPYCHGYEYSNDKTGILANGDMAFEMGKLISNWTKDLTVFTNGKSTLTEEQLEKLAKHNIKVIETAIDRFEHNKGQIENIHFKDGSKTTIKALYARPAFEQHCTIPEQLGCELTEQNYIKIDPFQKTTQHSIFACGDNTTPMRLVANAVAMGALSGVMVNRELTEEEFG